MSIFFDINHDKYLQKNECGCSENKKIFCDRCNSQCYGPYDLEYINGQYLCDECKDEVLKEYAKDYTDEFLDTYPEDKFDFYVNSLGSFLSDDERKNLRYSIIEMIKIMFESQYNLYNGLKEFVDGLKLDYCLDSDGFLEFVEKKVKNIDNKEEK